MFEASTSSDHVIQSASSSHVVELFPILQDSWADEEAELKREEPQKTGH